MWCIRVGSGVNNWYSKLSLYLHFFDPPLAPARMFSRIEQGFLDRGRPKEAYHIQNAVKIVEFFYRFRWIQKLWIDKLLELEFQAMSLVQAEVADTEIVHSLEKQKKVTGNLSKDEQETLEKAQNRLSQYNTVWWGNTHDYYQLLFHKRKGYYIRQLDLFRNGHLSFTEEEIQPACKALGGCCAYDCGCCYRDRGSSKKPSVLMHCMRECGCCLRRRGRDVPIFGKDTMALRIILVDYWCRNGVRSWFGKQRRNRQFMSLIIIYTV